MGYLVYVKRGEDLGPNSPSNIEWAEVIDVVANDPSFEDTSTDEVTSLSLECVVGEKTHFLFHHGTLEVTTPNDSALIRMQEIAVALNARVIGEEGEDITDTSVPTGSGCAGLLALPLVLAVLSVVLAVITGSS
jgi:hypothetical protein